MAIRNQNWYNLQSTRRYPIDEQATGEDDTGATLRDDILVDCHLRFPQTLGTYAYVQGLTVSSTLVTVVFGAAATLDSTTPTTIAAVSLLKPVDGGVNYVVKALQPGVSGWVTFGPGVQELFSGKYSTPRQSFIGQRNARAYAPLPIPTLGKLGLADALSGVVNIVADTPMTATYYENYTLPKYDPETNQTNTAPVKALVFSCIAPSADFNPHSYFLGPCGQRPESGTCNKTPIETINGVSPDCLTGNINIVVSGGLTVHPFTECGGLDITTPLGLSDACEQTPPGEKRRQDICCPNEDGEGEFCWPTPRTGGDFPTEPGTGGDFPQAFRAYPELPVRLRLAPTAIKQFDVRSGVFSTATQAEVTTYCAQSRTGMSLAVFEQTPSDWTLGRTVGATFVIDAGGLHQNAGVVLNYVTVREGGKQKTKYVLVMYDADANNLTVYRHTGDLLVKENQIGITAIQHNEHRITAQADANDDGTTTITAALYDITTATTVVQFQTIISEFDVADGRFGFAANASQTHFIEFTIQ